MLFKNLVGTPLTCTCGKYPAEAVEESGVLVTTTACPHCNRASAEAAKIVDAVTSEIRKRTN